MLVKCDENVKILFLGTFMTRLLLVVSTRGAQDVLTAGQRLGVCFDLQDSIITITQSPPECKSKVVVIPRSSSGPVKLHNGR